MAGRRHAAHSAADTQEVEAPVVGRMVAVVVAVIVCILVVAVALSRSDAPTSGSTPTTTSASIAVDLSAPTQSLGDARRQMTRSRAGAVNAAAGYATLLARLFPLEVAQAKSVVAEAASDDARDRLVAAVEANLLPLQEQANGIEGTTTYRQAVLATRLVSYSDDAPAPAETTQQAAAGARARVRVWTLLTVAQTPQMPDRNSNAIGSFGTVKLSLVWERGAWRIDDSTTLDGPTPLIDGPPSSGAQLNSALGGFVDWRP